MGDLMDRAAAREAELLEESLARNRAALGGGPSRTNCAECAEPIPPERRRAVPGCLMCVHCQAISETRNARST